MRSSGGVIELKLFDESRLRSVFESAPIGMAVTTLDGRIERVNRAFCHVVGRSEEVLQRMQLSELTYPDDATIDASTLERLLSGELDQVVIEKRYLHGSGSVVWARKYMTIVRDHDATPLHLLCQIVDITERRELEEELQHMADRDPLTGLLNRRRFGRELEGHLADAARSGVGSALLMIDLDGLKYVNDTLGHAVGDHLVVSVAKILRGSVRNSDLVARLGGDEFCVLLPACTSADAEALAEELLTSVRDASLVEGAALRPVTASIGVAMAGRQEISADQWLINADLAMYDAKEAGRNRVASYATSEREHPRIKTRLALLNQITLALDAGRLSLYSMPILDLAEDVVDRHELLLRMRTTRGDIVPASTFISVAERFDIIDRIDRWVVVNALQMLASGACPVDHIAVNLSGRSMADPSLPEFIEEQLNVHGIEPSRLTFELTETAAVADVGVARRFAERLRQLGCRFSLDDFGAGFDSFHYLKQFPFDYLKIDGEFVRGCTHDRADRLIISSMVSLAKGLGRKTVAEYVTDADTLDLVRELGVDYAQGFHVGRPQPTIFWQRPGTDWPQNADEAPA